MPSDSLDPDDTPHKHILWKQGAHRAASFGLVPTVSVGMQSPPLQRRVSVSERDAWADKVAETMTKAYDRHFEEIDGLPWVLPASDG